MWRSVLLVEETAIPSRKSLTNFITFSYFETLFEWTCFVNYKKGALAVASDKVYQLLAHGRWFSPGTPASSITKTGCHDS
jgi:hypothetical protein